MKPRVDYFSSEELQHDLRGKTVRGGAWTMVGQGAAFLLQLASIPILARLLDPTDFGLVAMVTVFTGFAAFFVDAGLSAATIQRKEVTPSQVSNLLWAGLLLGGLVALIQLALAPAVAWFYDEPQLIPVMMALAVTPIFSSLSIQHEALLRRTMQFRTITIRGILVTTIAQVTTILVAWFTRSYWALVLLPILLSCLRMLTAWLCCHWRPSLPSRRSGVREMLRFGGNLTIANSVNYFATSIDRMVIGKIFGPQATGFYEQAWKLLLYPVRQIRGTVGAVMTPALSRLQDRPEAYRRTYLDVVNLLFLGSIPIIAVLIAAPHWTVECVLGPGWEETGHIIQILAFSALSLVVGQTAGWLFITQGRVVEMKRWQIVDALTRPVLIAIGVPWGILGIATVYSIRTFIQSLILYWYLGRRGPIASYDLYKQFFIASINLAGTAVTCRLTMPAVDHLPLGAGLAIICLVAVVVNLTLWSIRIETRQVLVNLVDTVNRHVLRRAL